MAVAAVQLLRLARDDKMPGISITPQSTAAFLPVRIEPPAKAPAPLAKPDVDPPASFGAWHERMGNASRAIGPMTLRTCEIAASGMPYRPIVVAALDVLRECATFRDP